MTRRLDDRDREGGFTLVELIVAVAIMSFAFVAIMAALGTAIIVSDVNKRQATAESVLGSYAETLKATAYVACPTTQYDASALGVNVPTGYSWSRIISWDGDPTTGSFDNPATTCPGSDPGLEQVTLTVTTARGVTKTTSILKRKP